MWPRVWPSRRDWDRHRRDRARKKDFAKENKYDQNEQQSDVNRGVNSGHEAPRGSGGGAHDGSDEHSGARGSGGHGAPDTRRWDGSDERGSGGRGRGGHRGSRGGFRGRGRGSGAGFDESPWAARGTRGRE